MFIKKTIVLILILLFVNSLCYADETIRAQNNAYRHNNKGLYYLKENYYYGAIKEFQIAIDLLPNSQASTVYYINLASTYEKIGYDNLALPNYEKALSLNPLCFEYYLKLAQCYKKLDMVDSKIVECQSKTESPLSKILLGLLYIQKGNISTGITILDDFCDKEKNLLVTSGVKEYLKTLSNKKL